MSGHEMRQKAALKGQRVAGKALCIRLAEALPQCLQKACGRNSRRMTKLDKVLT